MALSKVKVGWSEGHLIFKDRASNASIMTIKDGTDGVYFDKDMEITSQYMKGQRFTVTQGPYAYAAFPVCLFVAPAPCKVVSAQEFHTVVNATEGAITVLKQGGVLNSAQGTNCLASTFANNTDIYNVVAINATNSTGLSELTTGDRVGAITALGVNLAGVHFNLVMEWL